MIDEWPSPPPTWRHLNPRCSDCTCQGHLSNPLLRRVASAAGGVGSIHRGSRDWACPPASPPAPSYFPTSALLVTQHHHPSGLHVVACLTSHTHSLPNLTNLGLPKKHTHTQKKSFCAGETRTALLIGLFLKLILFIKKKCLLSELFFLLNLLSHYYWVKHEPIKRLLKE